MIEPIDVVAGTRQGKRDAAVAAGGIEHARARRQQFDEGGDDLRVPLGPRAPREPVRPELCVERTADLLRAASSSAAPAVGEHFVDSSARDLRESWIECR